MSNWWKLAQSRSDRRYMQAIDMVISAIARIIGNDPPTEPRVLRVRVPFFESGYLFIVHVDDLSTFGAYDMASKRIYMRTGLSPYDYYSVLSHELAHFIQDLKNPGANMMSEDEEAHRSWDEWRRRHEATLRSGLEPDEMPPDDPTWYKMRAYSDQEMELHALAMEVISIGKMMLTSRVRQVPLSRGEIDGVAKEVVTFFRERARREHMQLPRDTSEDGPIGDEEAGEADYEEHIISRNLLPDVKRDRLVERFARRVMGALVEFGMNLAKRQGFSGGQAQNG